MIQASYLQLVAALLIAPAAERAVVEHVASRDLSGASAVIVVADEIVYAGAAGVADLQTGRAMTADTPIYAGSLSKIFTAVLTLHLVEAGELALDQHPAFGSVADEASVHDLLTHTSGLSREGDFGYWFTGRFPDAAALDDYLGRTRQRYPPGARLRYSNIGYATLGLLAERSTGRPFETLLHERVIEPLELDRSGAPGPVEGLARGYTPKARLVPNQTRPFAGVGEAVGERRLREYHDARAMTPAFGIYTSARDLGRLARFLLGNGDDGVLSPAMRRRMLTRQPSGWGLGLGMERRNGRTIARHSGWFAAHRSYLLLDADAGLAVAVLTNSDDGSPAALAQTLYALILEAAGMAENGGDN